MLLVFKIVDSFQCILNTVIVKIEKCLNSQPLMYLTEKHEDMVITPNHLVHGRDIDRNDTVQHKFNELSVRKRQAYCKIIFKYFTKRFVKEYLLALQETYPYTSHKNSPSRHRT